MSCREAVGWNQAHQAGDKYLNALKGGYGHGACHSLNTCPKNYVKCSNPMVSLKGRKGIDLAGCK